MVVKRAAIGQLHIGCPVRDGDPIVGQTSASSLASRAEEASLGVHVQFGKFARQRVAAPP